MIPLRDLQPRKGVPAVTLLLIAVNTLLFVYELSLGPDMDGSVAADGGESAPPTDVALQGAASPELASGEVAAPARFLPLQLPSAPFWVVLIVLMVPFQITLIPLYVTVVQLGWLNTFFALVVPRATNAFGIFLMRQFIKGVPDELIEAARLDGASELRILFRVVAPTVTPALAALTLFAFVYHWNSYLWPLTVLQGNTDQYPIVLSLGRLLSYTRSAQNTNQVMAGAALAVLPPLVLFAVLQRYFVRTIARTGLSG